MARYRIKYDIGPDYSTPPNLEDFKFNLLHQTMMPMRDILNLIELLLVENWKNYMAGFLFIVNFVFTNNFQERDRKASAKPW